MVADNARDNAQVRDSDTAHPNQVVAESPGITEVQIRAAPTDAITTIEVVLVATLRIVVIAAIAMVEVTIIVRSTTKLQVNLKLKALVLQPSATMRKVPLKRNGVRFLNDLNRKRKCL